MKHLILWESADEDAAHAYCIGCSWGSSGRAEGVTVAVERHEAENADG